MTPDGIEPATFRFVKHNRKAHYLIYNRKYKKCKKMDCPTGSTDMNPWNYFYNASGKSLCT